jgi:ABC-2 type transport system permease protein
MAARSTPTARSAPTARSGFTAVLRKEASLLSRDIRLVVLLVVAPLILVVFLSRALGGATLFDHEIAYVAVDGVDLAAVTEALGEPDALVSEAEARAAVASGDVRLAVLAGADGTSQIITNAQGAADAPAVLAQIGASDTAVVAADGTPIDLSSTPYRQTIPGFFSMFAFFAVAFTAHAFFRESMWGTWDRLLSLPVPRVVILLGKSVSIVGVVAVQGIALVLGGALLFDVEITNPAIVVLGSTLVGCVAVGVGLLLIAMTRSEIQAQQMTNLIVLSLATIGGAIAPVAALPSWVQVVAPASPHYWAVDLIKAGLGGYDTMGRLLLDAAVLIAMAVGAGVVAIRMMPWARLRRATA